LLAAGRVVEAAKVATCETLIGTVPETVPVLAGVVLVARVLDEAALARVLDEAALAIA
jgi:hypothetical protein